jgi:Leucine-rich repeat (LRR) protein
MLEGLQNLEELSFWENKITSIEVDSFSELFMLTSLDLSSNSITEIYEETFRGLPNIKL